MERYDFYLSGEINGIKKKEKSQENKNKMLYIVKKIKDEINNNFKNQKEIYIYSRFNKKNNILQLFVILLQNTKYNKRNIDITYLIKVNDDYPFSPPFVHCLTEFNNNLDIFDMRNVQKNIIPEWSVDYTINDFILKLPAFTDSVDYQVSKRLIPSVGEYYLKSTIYDINDFLLNNNNKFFRVKIVSYDNNNSDEIEFKEMYIIITKNNFLFLKSIDKENKNLCIIKYVINIIGIERLRRFVKEGEKYKGLSCFKIIPNKNINYNIKSNVFKRTMCVDENNLIIKQINELINKRKEEINLWFKYFENLGCNDVKEIEQIIEIKEEIIKNKVDDNIFYQIHQLYNKLIELSSNKDEEEEESDFSIYVKKLQLFLDNYDKMKNEENDKDNKLDEKLQSDYNFGFE